uniref:Transketolase-like pyrimidine-binding domain-containing protein n=1 Tax=uncultured bacterium esnapd17 TaxID=1366598 RepID=S5TV30_9BACT|nr:hypothetical protein [uncultured bacterium esnapd17]
MTASPRQVYWDSLVALAKQDERVVCLDSDMGGLEKTFGAAFPDRYVNVGIAEANLFSVAAGMAARGHIPYVHTMATFASTRACEQLKLDIAGTGLPVRVVASHGGLSAAHFGTTHWALEDFAVTRALPTLTVVVPADAEEIPTLLPQIHELPGPAYLRLGRSATPAVHEHDVRLGRATRLREGRDATVVACGPYPTLMALEAADRAAEDGLELGVLGIHTLAPLDADAVLDAARRTGALVTVEEHRPTGGLGDAVAEVTGAHAPCPIVRVAVGDPLPDTVQEHRRLLELTGVSTDAVLAAVRRVTAHPKGGQ